MESGKNSAIGPGEVSFSWYLGTAEGNFVKKLTDQYYPNHFITSSPEIPSSRSSARTKTEEGEIGVFDAKKYYNMKLDNGPIIIDTAIYHGYSKVPRVDLLHSKTKNRPGTPSAKSRPGTPSVSSEASYNSQSAFLRTYQRNLSQSKQKKVSGMGFFSGLICHGSCLNKKSVYTDQNVELGGLVRVQERRKKSILSTSHSHMMFDGRRRRQPIFKVKDEFYKPSVEKMTTESNKDKFLAIPVAKSGVQNLAVKKQSAKLKLEEESRPSLEVFGSHETKNKEVIEVNLERKLSMLTWDAIPKAPNLPTSTVRRHVYEDTESDTSSNLFEIDNISDSTGQPVFRRQISDGMSSCKTPTRYEPSETSIQWSVVTASAANGSVVSDYYDEKKLIENNIRTPRLATAASKVAETKSTDKDVQGSRPSKLLGCKNQKAVTVAESAYRINNKQRLTHNSL